MAKPRRRNPSRSSPHGPKIATGRAVVLGNIRAATDLSRVLRSTLGPRGMEKAIVSKRTGRAVVTDDGQLILRGINIRHAAAKMLAGMGDAQGRERGDGVASSVLLCGELLREARELVDQGVPQQTIAGGYDLAAQATLTWLHEAEDPAPLRSVRMREVVLTALSGKVPELWVEAFADAILEAVNLVAREREGKLVFEPSNVLLDIHPESTPQPVVVSPGMIVHASRIHPEMPARIEGAKVMLLQGLLNVPVPRIKGELIIRSPEELRAAERYRSDRLRDLVDDLKEVGADVVACDGWATPELGRPLAQRGILVLQSVDRKVLSRLAKATGARIISRYVGAKPEDLGHAGLVEECRVADRKGTRFAECRETKVVTILLRRAVPSAFPPLDRAINNALWAAKAALEAGSVPGGGAVEVELSNKLRGYAMEIDGKEQLAVLAFADALEGVPRALAESVGASPLDVLVGLRASRAGARHEAAGIDARDLRVRSVAESGIWDARSVKAALIDRAAQTAAQILRVDGAIPARRTVREMKDTESVSTPYPQWMRTEEDVHALSELEARMPSFRDMRSRIPKVKLEDILEHQ